MVTGIQRFQNSFGLNLFNQFGWANQVQTQLSTSTSMSTGGASAVADVYQGISSGMSFGGGMSSFSVSNWASYASMPDFENAGHLEVDKKNNMVKTPGGYGVEVKDGKVKIHAPNGKITQLKAEPPDRTVEKTATKTETRTRTRVERQLRRDPVVRESDGDVWRYSGTGSFQLPDGTKITIQEKGKDKDLHINQVDVYNGNKHVGIKSDLKSAEWETLNRKVETTGTASNWRTTSRRRTRNGRVTRITDTQQRSITQKITEQQRAKQAFETTFSNVQKNGFAHDAANDDGAKFRLAGDGDDWTVNGREVVSGAGKGKDNKELAYQLGNKMDPSWLGHKQLHVPWKTVMTGGGMSMSATSSSLFNQQFGMTPGHFNMLQSSFSSMQTSPHLGLPTSMSSINGINSIYGGPFGGAALFGMGFSQGFSPQQQFGQMQLRVEDIMSILGKVNNYKQQLEASIEMQRYEAWARKAQKIA